MTRPARRQVHLPEPTSGESFGQRQQMARALAVMYASGATVALISSAMPHTAEVNVMGTTLTALLGYPAAGILWFGAGRLRRWTFHVFLAIGTVITTVGVYFGGDGPNGTAAASYYIWVALYSFYFFHWKVGSAHVSFVALAYAVVLAIQRGRGGAAEWVLIIGTNAVAGFVVGYLADQVRGLARVDSLTGLANRRAWDETLPREIAHADRQDRPLCVVIIDLDHFKKLNDSQGHRAGDELLKQIASQWAQQLRAGDMLARVGGDELAVILPVCTPDEATEIVERLRATTPDGHTFSAGVARWDGSESSAALVNRADRSLYEAKRRGRNRTAIAEPDGQSHPPAEARPAAISKEA